MLLSAGPFPPSFGAPRSARFDLISGSRRVFSPEFTLFTYFSRLFVSGWSPGFGLFSSCKPFPVYFRILEEGFLPSLLSQVIGYSAHPDQAHLAFGAAISAAHLIYGDLVTVLGRSPLLSSTPNGDLFLE